MSDKDDVYHLKNGVHKRREVKGRLMARCLSGPVGAGPCACPPVRQDGSEGASGDFDRDYVAIGRVVEATLRLPEVGDARGHTRGRATTPGIR